MKRYLYLFVFTLVAFACNNEDDGAPNNDSPFEGQWSLVNVSGGLAGVDEDFEMGLITWDFDIETQELTITNTNTASVFSGFPTGVYDFQVLTNGEMSSLILEDSFSMVITTLTNNQLILDEGVAADGFLYTFAK